MRPGSEQGPKERRPAEPERLCIWKRANPPRAARTSRVRSNGVSNAQEEDPQGSVEALQDHGDREGRLLACLQTPFGELQVPEAQAQPARHVGALEAGAEARQEATRFLSGRVTRKNILEEKNNVKSH